jgi:hypothetical protein
VAELADYERRFRRAGLPLFIEDYSAREDVWTRAVPLLLVFALVLFINIEMWQVFSGMPDAFVVLVGVLFVLAGSVFVAAQLPREVRRLEEGAGDRASGPSGRSGRPACQAS